MASSLTIATRRSTEASRRHLPDSGLPSVGPTPSERGERRQVAENCGAILLVDGDDAFRTYLTAVLERAGYETLGVASAEEALTAIAGRQPDVVLTDVDLQGVSGYELCRQLRDEYGEALAVIIVT